VNSNDPYAPRGPDPYAVPRAAGPQPLPPENLAAESEDEVVAEEPLELNDDMLAAAPPRRFDFERGMSRLPVLTIGLIVVLIVVFIWEVATHALANEAAIMRAGALERKAVQAGEWWRIPASMHLHGSFDHLAGNCFGLFLLGLAIEHAYGFGPAALMYFVAGTAGAVLSLAFEGGPTVGASGAIFGWWGAAVVFYFRYRDRLTPRDTRVGFVLLVWAGWTILTGFLQPEVSNFSHLGGFLAGAGLALLIPTRLTELKT
jgi:rhomboid protease GluP